MSVDFAADLDDLLELVEQMGRCGADLETLAREVADHDAALHRGWHGQASASHLTHQSDWQGELDTMRESLHALRTHVARAEHGYAGAVEANVRLWSELR